MSFKFRSLLRVTSLLMLSLTSVQTFASSEAKSWFVMGQHTDREKQTHLFQSWQEAGGKNLYGIHTYQLPKFGRSFSYDGAIEGEFQHELAQRSDDELTILIPAFGSGRSVLDTLTGHATATVIANEIQEQGYLQLKELAKTYHVDLSRVKKLSGDILKKLDTLESQSVDLVYATNLIHFFTPQQVESFLTQLKRVIKADGKIFISWRGFPDSDPTVDVKMSKGTKEKFAQVKFLEALELPYPRFIRENDFGPSEWGLNYYHAKNSDIILHGARTGFNCISNAVSELTSVTLQNMDRQVIANLGEYKHVKVSALHALRYMPVSNHVVLQVNEDFDSEEHDAIIDYEDMIEARTLKINQNKCHNDGCLSVAKSKCGRCKSVRYCSRECQLKSWGTHKKVCKKPNI